ncbi:PREDICTED: mimitin, mitochondrial [Apaloderma vittatum]|uniref:mimitin, mitochondrial n=1 Tax=Apaloderma vittatum TaxID=57397 RepID=UPI00052193AB|nr:PREDICTED: mimitin, mitochondrial [Apaloderma vittatum]
MEEEGVVAKSNVDNPGIGIATSEAEPLRRRGASWDASRGVWTADRERILPMQSALEILKNENYREEMKRKVKDVSEKDKLLQAKEYKEGLVAEPGHTRVKGHASAPYYGKKEPSQDPTSTASTFQPGSWMPPGSGSSHNK